MFAYTFLFVLLFLFRKVEFSEESSASGEDLNTNNVSKTKKRPVTHDPDDFIPLSELVRKMKDAAQ